MTKQSENTSKQPVNEDDVLRRMLSTPPQQHEKKPKPAKKSAKPLRPE